MAGVERAPADDKNGRRLLRADRRDVFSCEDARRLPSQARIYCVAFNLRSNEGWRLEPWIAGGCVYRVYNIRTGELIRQDATAPGPCALELSPPFGSYRR